LIAHADSPVLYLSADKYYVTIASATPAPVPDKLKDIAKLHYVARQPIFDRDQKVFGYELLFRDGLENAFTGTDADAASRATLDNSLLIGLDTLCDGRRAFVNCTRDTLIKGLVTLLPSQSTVVEVLESVPADPDVMAACKRLKEAGYLIALDDYITDDPREPLTEMADIIKDDMKLTTLGQRADLIKRFGQWRCRVLAEKVETREEFAAAREQGFVYFQGYFFRRPEVLAAHSMPGNSLNYLRMMREVSRPELDVPALERLIKGEASICYRLLRYLNSSVFGFKSEIHSVRHALSILGEREVSGWSRLWQRARINPATWCFPRWSGHVLGSCWRRWCRAANRIFSCWDCFRSSMPCWRCRWRRCWKRFLWTPKPKRFCSVSRASCVQSSS
jgi:c-di-GMP-related signal transduction protein